MSAKNVYNMPSGAPFLPLLAEGLTEYYGDSLQKALILLPTRRAVQSMRQALADVAQSKGRKATLLPRMRPLADINPEEPPFEPGELIGQVPPAMSNLQRRFEMAKLVTAYHRRAADLPLDPAAALALADPLLAIMDDAAMEEVSITDTDEWQRVMADSALHFQHAATLYKIIENYWPERLRELGLIEGQARKVTLLNLLTKSWRYSPPDYPVIIAGSTGTLKATAKLMACVSSMPKGMIVLPGLQTTTDQNWDSIDIQHPQWSMKNLLRLMELDRDDVVDFRQLTSSLQKLETTDLRRMVINEALVAVDKTSDWLGRIHKLQTDHGDDVFTRAMDGLSLISAPNDEDEALTIALIMREALNDNSKTAALVTPDQGLARRVHSRLKRWGVVLDMSQGEPISQTLIGSFLIAILQLAKDLTGPVELSVLFNHPYLRLGMDPGNAKANWQDLERREFRGVRPNGRGEKFELLRTLDTAMNPLSKLDGFAPTSSWAESLMTAAETLASRTLWSSAAGSQVFSMLEDVVAFGADLPSTTAEGMERFLHRMMRSAVARSQNNNQPRLSILGPLEARLITADVIVLGGMNEGVWPSTPAVDPFLSRQMRDKMELSLPERRYGLSAHDFAELAANKSVFLTRSERSDSGPTVASRWVWRLRVLLDGALGEEAAKTLLATGSEYLKWAQHIDYVPLKDVTNISPPNFGPPVNKRWAYYKGNRQVGSEGRRMSITQVQTWIRDPYAIYAKCALGLIKLDELDMPHDARQFGNAIHKAIENFIKSSKPPYSESDIVSMKDYLNVAFKEQDYPPELISHEKARFENIARDVLKWLQKRYELGYDVINPEIYADYVLPDHNFRLTGLADLVEQGPEGYAFFDFKTGQPSQALAVASGFDPQLPLSAFLAAQGAFEGVASGVTRQLGYVRVKGSNNDFKESFINAPEARNGKDAMVLAQEAFETLSKLIDDYDNEEQTYPSQPRVKFVNGYGDYDHLARRPEWRGLDDENGEGIANASNQ